MQIETWPLVLIEWDDAQSEGDAWQSFATEDIKKSVLMLQKCISVGWLLKETKDILWLAPHLALKNEVDTDYQRFGAIHIPKFAITKRITLIDHDEIKNLQNSLDTANKVS